MGKSVTAESGSRRGAEAGSLPQGREEGKKGMSERRYPGGRTSFSRTVSIVVEGETQGVAAALEEGEMANDSGGGQPVQIRATADENRVLLVEGTKKGTSAWNRAGRPVMGDRGDSSNEKVNINGSTEGKKPTLLNAGAEAEVL